MSLTLTPDQIKEVELNRLRGKYSGKNNATFSYTFTAKAKQREREQEPSSSTNVNGKRPATSASGQKASQTRLQRDSRLGTYFEYDLSKMVNSKGGFLMSDDTEIDEATRRKEMERERQRTMQNMEPPINLDLDKNPKCQDCETIDIDHTYRKVFGCIVCKRCTKEKPERYSLLTKTECKEDYLLTDAELRDQEAMPHLLKANPHKSTFANMMLFLRYQVEEFAWKKWSSPEALDAEFERRTAEKKKTKNKKFEQGLKELRKRTREGVWQKRKDAEHKHVFGPDGDGVQICHECGFTAEHAQISTALEVEKLEVNLFRSKSLWVPVRARGVFGGQVISQALVSATNCVDPAFGLHCYFLTSASPATPIVYFVERLRQGRSYVACSVKAIQKGSLIFIMTCSFQKPEPSPPEQCEFEEDAVERVIRDGYDGKELTAKQKAYFESWASERKKSPIAVKAAKEHDTSADGVVRYMYWMKAKNIPEYEAPFQKCILGYLSDLKFIAAAFGIIGLDRFRSRGPNSIGMSSTIDHSVWFYNDSFDCGDWLLYVMESPRAGSGRAIMHGQLYTRTGTLIAVTSQEGVVRANIRGPSTVDSKPAAKL
ncbi:HotDog domain-containing protein [Rhodocollybia butyracea]|uniref:DNA repair protein RAD14 n=1 Tax=Rhodocollybia butyracea TaxID=206335 RepID=A0A9P5Q347_9AGAR|nr:HotDog domain-containing protein [Rhodocollybia butyracea]